MMRKSLHIAALMAALSAPLGRTVGTLPAVDRPPFRARGPQPLPHQGKREMARRVRQMARQRGAS